MHFLTAFMASLKSVMGIMAGQKAAKETTKLLHTARVAFIAAAAVAVLFCVCILIISTYFALRIVQMLA